MITSSSEGRGRRSGLLVWKNAEADKTYGPVHMRWDEVQTMFGGVSSHRVTVLRAGHGSRVRGDRREPVGEAEAVG